MGLNAINCDYQSLCPGADVVEKSSVEKLAIQYYDKDKIRGRLISLVSPIDEIIQVICSMKLSIDSSNHQLTKMGLLIGFQRCHCKITFCCNEPEYTDTIVAPESYCFDDDELYRRYLRAWTITKRSTGLVTDLIKAAMQIYGSDCRVTSYSDQVIVETGRDLSVDERILIGYTARVVLPRSHRANTQIIETTSQASC